ncbi:hypothetical protein LH398_04180 [Fusobacterium nucleatum]
MLEVSLKLLFIKRKDRYYVAGYKEVFITAKKVNAGEDREINKTYS